MPQQSLTTCIDQGGVYYRVPIACINDPIEYEQDDQMKKLVDMEVPPEAMIKVSFNRIFLNLCFIWMM